MFLYTRKHVSFSKHDHMIVIFDNWYRTPSTSNTQYVNNERLDGGKFGAVVDCFYRSSACDSSWHQFITTTVLSMQNQLLTSAIYSYQDGENAIDNLRALGPTRMNTSLQKFK